MTRWPRPRFRGRSHRSLLPGPPCSVLSVAVTADNFAWLTARFSSEFLSLVVASKNKKSYFLRCYPASDVTLFDRFTFTSISRCCYTTWSCQYSLRVAKPLVGRSFDGIGTGKKSFALKPRQPKVKSESRQDNPIYSVASRTNTKNVNSSILATTSQWMDTWILN